MMKVNRIVNCDFSMGKKAPRNWVWMGKRGTRWMRDSTGGVTVIVDRPDSSALWSQVVVAKPGDFYRVEATVRCNLAASGDDAGLILRVEPLVQGRSDDASRSTPGLHHADEPIAIRTYFRVAPGVRRIRVSIGTVNAVGTAWMGQVRFIPILEPDEMSHMLAVPPPPSVYSRPKAVHSVCVCSDQGRDRLLTRLLGEFFGESNVISVARADFYPARIASDAVFLPDAVLPSPIRTMEEICDLASRRIVVVSLPAFAKLTRGALTLRRVEQCDDPIHAKITLANYATPGFALNDTFAYAWEGSAAGSLVQNQFRWTPSSRKYCTTNGFEPLLVSMCEREATTDQPICLYKPVGAGGLFVLDIEPVEACASTFGEPTLALHLLLSILGATQAGLGQYCAPFREEPAFRDFIRETGLRCESFVVHDDDVPVEEVGQQLVTIGGEDQSFGLPLESKPVILMRSGLYSGDEESVFGAYLWFKQLIRTPPFECPYAHALAARFRLAWVPCVAEWGAADGWRRSAQTATASMELELEDAALGAIIDVVSRPVNRVRVVFSHESAAFRHQAAWLPKLMAAFTPGNFFVWNVADGEPFSDRRRFAWRRIKHELEMSVAEDAFTEPIHRDTLAAGGNVIRIELPGCDSDFVAQSIHRTAFAAAIIEQVVGLQYGLIAVNRSRAIVHFDGFPPVEAGKSLIVDRRDPILQSRAVQVG